MLVPFGDCVCIHLTRNDSDRRSTQSKERYRSTAPSCKETLNATHTRRWKPHPLKSIYRIHGNASGHHGPAAALQPYRCNAAFSAQQQLSFYSSAAAAAQRLQLSSSSSSALTAQQQLNNCSPFQPDQPCSTNSLAALTALQQYQPCSANSLAALTAMQN